MPSPFPVTGAFDALLDPGKSPWVWVRNQNGERQRVERNLDGIVVFLGHELPIQFHELAAVVKKFLYRPLMNQEIPCVIELAECCMCRELALRPNHCPLSWPGCPHETYCLVNTRLMKTIRDNFAYDPSGVNMLPPCSIGRHCGNLIALLACRDHVAPLEQIRYAIMRTDDQIQAHLCLVKPELKRWVIQRDTLAAIGLLWNMSAARDDGIGNVSMLVLWRRLRPVYGWDDIPWLADVVCEVAQRVDEFEHTGVATPIRQVLPVPGASKA